MATQTRRTTQRLARFFRTTVTASMVPACCGLVLWSAVTAHAAAVSNGMPYNGMPFNGLESNGMPFNGMPFNGMAGNGMPYNGLFVNGTPMQGMPMQGMPFNGMPFNGMAENGMPYNGMPAPEDLLPTAQSESLPWSTLSHQGVGKSTP
jgi:hypothetical protein